jgi:tetratricopeptide (TPR) repeat protein
LKYLKRYSQFCFCICVLVASPTFLLSVLAQDSTNVSPAKTQSLQTAQVPTTTVSRAVSRQQREQAYVNLLLGQRLLVQLSTREIPPALVVGMLKQAEAALTAATLLDPTLAEAHAALAEIAFFYPPRDMEEAVRRATAAVKINRNNFGGHQMLARIYALRSGLTSPDLDKSFAERAIVELLEVVRLVPNDAESWAVLGELYLALGRNDEAIRAFTRWSAAPSGVNPAFYEAITGRRGLAPDAAAARLAEALIKAGRRREAITAVRRALSLSPQEKSYEEIINKAVDAGGEDDESVITELRATIAAEPLGTVAPILLARLLTRLGRIDDAVQTLRSAISRRPEADKESTLSFRLALAQTLIDAERFSDGAAIYEEILLDNGVTGTAPVTDQRKKRLATELLRRIVGIYLAADKPKEAQSTFERLRRVAGNENPAIDSEEVFMLRALGKRREALRVIQTARTRFPDQIEFVYQEANILAELGRVEEGASLLRMRLSDQIKTPVPEATPLADIDLYLRISNLYTQAGKGSEGVASARKALDLAPADQPDIVAAALFTLSSAQERAGDAKGSEESLRRVLASDPDNATALNNLGYFLVERNERLNEALEMIERAVKAEPTNSSFLDSLGWAHYKLGRLDEAERHLTEAARRGTGSATIQEHLGDVYFDQGKKDLARAQWRKSLRLLANGEQAARIRSKLGRSSR